MKSAKRAGIGIAVLCLVAFATGAVAVARADAATETHVFEPVRSLTGGCGTSKLDPVPDPNCPDGLMPTSGAFFQPGIVATDPHGDIYVASLAKNSTTTYVNVFDPEGHYLTTVTFAGEYADTMAVDSEGDIYLSKPSGVNSITAVFKPEQYDPALGEITYETTPALEEKGWGGTFAINPSDNHVYVLHSAEEEPEPIKTEPPTSIWGITEYGSFAEGNPLIRHVVVDTLEGAETGHAVHRPLPSVGGAMVVDGKTGEIFVSSTKDNDATPSVVFVFNSDGSVKEIIEGVQTSKGMVAFTSPFGEMGLAIEEETGDLFIADLQGGATAPVYELGPGRELISTIEHSFEASGKSIALANGSANVNLGYLFVPSNLTGTGHLYAFRPKPHTGPPMIEGERASSVFNAEAILGAELLPGGLTTDYHFEYVTAAQYAADVAESGPGHGFDHANIAGGGTLSAGQGITEVSVPIVGLSPGTEYRFRLVARNGCEEAGPGAECVAAGEASSFSTYPTTGTGATGCPNQSLRTGLSGLLPDCRAFELVTPPDTNSQVPQAIGNGTGPHFSSPTVSPNGESISFLTIGGPIGRVGGTGAFWGDPYRAIHTSTGWQTSLSGPNAFQSSNGFVGSASADQGYSFFETETGGEGSLVIGGNYTSYLHLPNGQFELVGVGSLGTDPVARGLTITENGSHVVFSSVARLEPAAPAAGTQAIYDRTPGGATHVVSLLPGEVTPSAGEAAQPLGASADGAAIAFKLGQNSPLYLRVDAARTVEAAPTGSVFAGLSADGSYLFYLQGGDLFRYAVDSGETLRLTETGDAMPVNVSTDGSTAYFVSADVIDPGGVNPVGEEATGGGDNLYVWRHGEVHFVGTLDAIDVEGESESASGTHEISHALGNWDEAVSISGKIATDPSRSSEDGGVLLFESRAPLTGYESGGHREVYRYTGDELTCLSCDPTGQAAGTDASLMSLSTLNQLTDPERPVNRYSAIPNLNPGGTRAIFETPTPLVAGDTNGASDVYEWEADGTGTCVDPEGCISLISSGRGSEGSHLFGVSRSGDDVFFRTTDRLVASDGEATASIYDARVKGGIAAEAGAVAECLGEACQGEAEIPSVVTPASSTFNGFGNVPKSKATKCVKGKHKVREGAKAKCVANKKSKKQKKHPKSKKKHPSGNRSKRQSGKKGSGTSRSEGDRGAGR